MQRITATEREERKRIEKKEKKDREEEEERYKLSYNFVKYTLGLKHQVCRFLLQFALNLPLFFKPGRVNKHFQLFLKALSDELLNPYRPTAQLSRSRLAKRFDN